jgi:hypothetical protein
VLYNVSLRNNSIEFANGLVCSESMTVMTTSSLFGFDPWVCKTPPHSKRHVRAFSSYLAWETAWWKVARMATKSYWNNEIDEDALVLEPISFCSIARYI